ncbi:MAG: proline reductase-associated electron transfer protein PrdC [Streptococcaceae bacterium]|nr:proline reductase-associated electron transfer protein PrdC [Streptococcaceae bacterium]
MQKILIPLKQHVGVPCEPIVEVGDKVLRGQLIAKPAGLGANVHSSLTGEVVEISNGNIVIQPDEVQNLNEFVKIPETSSHVEAIDAAGIVGAGGAGFPTAIKIACDIPNGVFIANGAECEALLSHNVKQMNEHVEQLLRGMEYCMEITNAPKGVLAVKGKHKALVAHLKTILEDIPNIDVFELPDIYPAGDERMIVREVMNIILEPGQLPFEVGAVVDNTETIKRIAEAIELRKPFIDKDVTVSGRVKQKSTVFVNVPVGIPVGSLIQDVGGYVEPHGEIVLGGPMTGSAGTENSPVTKTTGGVLVAMPFPQEKRKVGILICECGGSDERMTHIAEAMGGEVVAREMCKRMVEVNGRYRCAMPGVCPGQAQTVLALKKEGAQVVLTGTCSD